MHEIPDSGFRPHYHVWANPFIPEEFIILDPRLPGTVLYYLTVVRWSNIPRMAHRLMAPPGKLHERASAFPGESLRFPEDAAGFPGSTSGERLRLASASDLSELKFSDLPSRPVAFRF